MKSRDAEPVRSCAVPLDAHRYDMEARMMLCTLRGQRMDCVHARHMRGRRVVCIDAALAHRPPMAPSRFAARAHRRRRFPRSARVVFARTAGPKQRRSKRPLLGTRGTLLTHADRAAPSTRPRSMIPPRCVTQPRWTGWRPWLHLLSAGFVEGCTTHFWPCALYHPHCRLTAHRSAPQRDPCVSRASGE